MTDELPKTKETLEKENAEAKINADIDELDEKYGHKDPDDIIDTDELIAQDEKTSIDDELEYKFPKQSGLIEYYEKYQNYSLMHLDNLETQ